MKLNRIVTLTKKCIAPLFCIYLVILVLKQLNLYLRFIAILSSFLPIFYGIIIAFLIQPVIDKLQKYFSKRWSVIFVYAGILVLLILLLIILFPVLYDQIIELFTVMPEWIVKLEAIFLKYNVSYESLNSLKDMFISDGTVYIVQNLKTIMNTFIQYGLGYATAFFISIDLDFWVTIFHRLPFEINRLENFYKTMSNIIFQYLAGTFLDLLFIAISTGCILYLSGFPSAILYAILLALLNLFPYIGATFGLLLIVIVGMLSYSNPPYFVYIIIWIIQQLESNLIQPLIFNRTMKVRAIFTFVSVFISEAFFGIPGLILSPILASVAQIAFRSYMYVKTTDSVGEWNDIWYDFDVVIKEVESL